MSSIVPPPRPNQLVFPKPVQAKAENTLNMAQAINQALVEILTQYPQVLVFGEDVAKKGGVYRVTADLQARFGKLRVFDTLLDEQTILGTAIGLAHNGFLPIPEIQFLAYTHNAADQIRAEAATLSFFSNGQYTNPMVIRIAGLGYQKGFGGHFHNDNAIAFLREVPGLMIACPSTPQDAGILLKECVRLAYEEQRVVVFLEPIALYMVKEEKYSLKNVKENINSTRTVISYGNGMALVRQAAQVLEKDHQITVKLFDLNWLAPLPFDALKRVLHNQSEVIVVDEGRQTGSLSETLLAWMIENINPLPKIKRICAKDSFIPIGNAWQYVLPSVQDIIDCVLSLNSPLRSD